MLLADYGLAYGFRRRNVFSWEDFHLINGTIVESAWTTSVCRA
jgi:hypothetical protein